MQPNHYAIVLGVSSSKNSELALPMAQQGALDFLNWLEKCAGVPRPNIKDLICDYGDNVMVRKSAVDDAIMDLLESANPEEGQGRLYFYYSGHGYSRDTDNNFLTCSDSVPTWPQVTIHRNEYERCLRTREKFPEQFFFIDSCREFDHTFSPGSPDWCCRGLPVEQEYAFQASQFKYYATDDRGLAYPNYHGSVGCFTHALIEGLQGAAADYDGVIRTGALGDYISMRVHELLEGSGRIQSPEPALTKVDSVIIETRTDTIPVTFVSESAHTIILRDPKLSRVLEVVELRAPSTEIRLRPIHYYASGDAGVAKPIDLRGRKSETVSWP